MSKLLNKINFFRGLGDEHPKPDRDWRYLLLIFTVFVLIAVGFNAYLFFWFDVSSVVEVREEPVLEGVVTLDQQRLTEILKHLKEQDRKRGLVLDGDIVIPTSPADSEEHYETATTTPDDDDFDLEQEDDGLFDEPELEDEEPEDRSESESNDD